MLFFTGDGGLVAGLTVRDDEGEPADRLRRRAERVAGRDGYLAWETPPPDTVEEFRRTAAAADPPRLVDGRLEP